MIIKTRLVLKGAHTELLLFSESLETKAKVYLVSEALVVALFQVLFYSVDANISMDTIYYIKAVGLTIEIKLISFVQSSYLCVCFIQNIYQSES